MRSGQWAAEALIEACPERYPARLHEEIEADLGRAARATELFYQAPIGQWMIPVCDRHPGVRRVLEDLLRCRQPYTGLRRTLLRAALQRLQPPT